MDIRHDIPDNISEKNPGNYSDRDNSHFTTTIFRPEKSTVNT